MKGEYFARQLSSREYILNCWPGKRSVAPISGSTSDNTRGAILETVITKPIVSVGRTLIMRCFNSIKAFNIKVTSYSHEDGGTIVLMDIHKIKVSRTKKKELLELLNEF